MPRGSKKFKHGHVAYQINGDYKQSRMQVKFLSKGQTGDLGVRSKAQISLNIDHIPNLCVFSQIEGGNHIEQNFNSVEQNFHSVAEITTQERDLGVLGVKNFSLGICDGAPSTARSSHV